MRKFIIGALDLLAVLLVFATTVSGGFSGYAAALQNSAYGRTGGDIQVVFVGLGVVGGFLAGVLISGSILALTEIARNTRRTVELLERQSGV